MLLQTAVHCGGSAANKAFTITQPVVKEDDLDLSVKSISR